jgi:hypothetical protein
MSISANGLGMVNDVSSVWRDVLRCTIESKTNGSSKITMSQTPCGSVSQDPPLFRSKNPNFQTSRRVYLSEAIFKPPASGTCSTPFDAGHNVRRMGEGGDGTVNMRKESSYERVARRTAHSYVARLGFRRCLLKAGGAQVLA